MNSGNEPSSGTPALLQLSREFTDDMYENYRYLVSHCNYPAERFLHLITMLGGVEAANQGLDLPEPPGGFNRLKQINQLGRSVEAWVQLPKYKPLFSETRRDVSRQRLLSAGFDLDHFLDTTPAGRSS